MDLTPELKAEIDAKSYLELLRGWRFSPIGDAMFYGESGEYWGERMRLIRSQPGGDSLHTAVSKAIDRHHERKSIP